VTQYRLEANIALELDVEAAFEWYEVEEQTWVLRFSKSYDRRINEFSTTLWPFKNSALASAVL
jgi:hypothetical protein